MSIQLGRKIGICGMAAMAVLSGVAANGGAVAPFWRLAYEKPGMTNYVTAADNPTAIRV